jgi:hypothetical protein
MTIENRFVIVENLVWYMKYGFLHCITLLQNNSCKIVDCNSTPIHMDDLKFSHQDLSSTPTLFPQCPT